MLRSGFWSLLGGVRSLKVWFKIQTRLSRDDRQKWRIASYALAKHSKHFNKEFRHWCMYTNKTERKQHWLVFGNQKNISLTRLYFRHDVYINLYSSDKQFSCPNLLALRFLLTLHKPDSNVPVQIGCIKYLSWSH